MRKFEPDAIRDIKAIRRVQAEAMRTMSMGGLGTPDTELWGSLRAQERIIEEKGTPAAIQLWAKELWLRYKRQGSRMEIKMHGKSWITRLQLMVYALGIGEKPFFLFPEERKTYDVPRNISARTKGEEFTHSPDFRSINKDGKPFLLTSKQAQVIQMLYDAHKEGLPGLGKDRILEDVSGGSRLRDIFKSNPEAFKVLIKISEKRRGIYRLNI
jgi:hypothetical protein